MEKFFFGFLLGAAVIVILASISIEAERNICKLQHYDGAACQCRIVLYGDGK
jgi:hypothetical protein